MKKIRIVLIALAAALLALPPVFGYLTETQVRERVESLNANDTLSVEIRSFDRGWFTSTALLTVAPAESRAAAAGPADPVALLFDGPLDVRVDFSHGPVSLRDGFFVGTSEFVARPADAVPAGGGASQGPYRFEFHGQATFGNELHFLAILPPLDRDGEAGALSFSGGRASGTVAGQRIKASGQAQTLRVTNGAATLAVQGIRVTADNEFRSRYRVPGDFEVAIERASLDTQLDALAPAEGLAPAGASTIDMAGLVFRTNVRLDERRDLLDGTTRIEVGSARFGPDAEITTGRLNVAARRLDAAALEAASQRLEQTDAEPALEDMTPYVERLLESGPSVTVNPLRFDFNNAPFEATLHAEASPAALPDAGPADLGGGLWRDVLSGRAELTAAKRLVERMAAAAVRTQLAAQYEDGSAVPYEALDTMAEAQAALVLAMLSAQGILEDRDTAYHTELRFENGALTVNGRPLPFADLL